jgi:hypothetical protein
MVAMVVIESAGRTVALSHQFVSWHLATPDGRLGKRVGQGRRRHYSRGDTLTHTGVNYIEENR